MKVDHHPTKGNKKGYNERQGETRPWGRRTHHPTKGNKNGDMLGEKGRQDPSGRWTTIQQREIRRGTMRDKGRQDPGEGGHTIQQRETRMGTCWEKRGDKTPREGGPPSNKGK